MIVPCNVSADGHYMKGWISDAIYIRATEVSISCVS